MAEVKVVDSRPEHLRNYDVLVDSLEAEGIKTICLVLDGTGSAVGYESESDAITVAATVGENCIVQKIVLYPKMPRLTEN